MASRDIIIDLALALKILDITFTEYERRQQRGFPVGINTKTNQEKIRDAILHDLSKFCGVDYAELEFDEVYNRKKLNSNIKGLLAKNNPKSFILGRIPGAAPRPRPMCKL